MPIITPENPGDQQVVDLMRQIADTFGVDFDRLMAGGDPGDALIDPELEGSLRHARVQIAELIRFALAERAAVTEVTGKALLAAGVLMGQLSPELTVTMKEALPNPWPPEGWKSRE